MPRNQDKIIKTVYTNSKYNQQQRPKKKNQGKAKEQKSKVVATILVKFPR